MGYHFPSPGDLPDPGIKPGSPTLEADTLTSEPLGKPSIRLKQTYNIFYEPCGNHKQKSSIATQKIKRKESECNYKKIIKSQRKRTREEENSSYWKGTRKQLNNENTIMLTITLNTKRLNYQVGRNRMT